MGSMINGEKKTKSRIPTYPQMEIIRKYEKNRALAHIHHQTNQQCLRTI